MEKQQQRSRLWWKIKLESPELSNPKTLQDVAGCLFLWGRNRSWTGVKSFSLNDAGHSWLLTGVKFRWRSLVGVGLALKPPCWSNSMDSQTLNVCGFRSLLCEHFCSRKWCWWCSRSSWRNVQCFPCCVCTNSMTGISDGPCTAQPQHWSCCYKGNRSPFRESLKFFL